VIARDETEVVGRLLTEPLEDDLDLVSVADDVDLLGVLLARREREAAASLEEVTLVLEVLVEALLLLLHVGKQFEEDAAEAPHVGGLVVLLLD